MTTISLPITLEGADIIMKQSELFAILPDYVCTPDSMEIGKNGDLIVSCPNYADVSLPGCVIRIDKAGNIRKWFDVPVHPETGCARNMGIALDDDENVYLCDNQGWSGAPELQYKGRILKIKADENGNILDWVTVAKNMEHPNGIRILGGYMYVTQSLLTPATASGENLLSCVYQFGLDETDVDIDNTAEDPHILSIFETKDPNCQYGVDGIVFDQEERLYIGNFGDGEVWRLTIDKALGALLGKELFAVDHENLQSTDGMIFDNRGNLYIADFSANAVGRITPDGIVERYAASPDSDGLRGELNQPGEPIVWEGKLICSCFDLVTGPDKVNSGHSMPATLAQLELAD
ncbi:phage head-tail adapter protein [Clostridia bacterium]|nr:phage head-tail adapter protein [Clostridia bacterium]